MVRGSSDILIGVNSINDISYLVYKDYFVKNGKKKLSIDDKRVIECEEILNLRKSYEKIILPFLIVDSYHEEKLITDNNYLIKLMIYVALSKCKDELILLCPKNKKKEVMKIFKNIKNIFVFE